MHSSSMDFVPLERAWNECSQGGGQEAFQVSLYLGIHVLSAAGCGLGYFVSTSSSRPEC